jgi:hypothetical protein
VEVQAESGPSQSAVRGVRTARRRVRRSVRRVVVQVLGLRPEGQRRARPERRCSAGFPGVAAALPEGLPRPVSLRKAAPIVIPAVQPGRLMALRLARTAALRRERAKAARPGVPDAIRCPGRLSAAAAQKARALLQAGPTVPRLAEPKVQGQPVAGPRSAERAGSAEVAAEVPREEVAPQAVAVRPKAVPAAWGAAAGPQQAAGLDAEVVLQPEAAAGPDVAAVAPRQVAERGAEVVRLQVAEALDAEVARLPAAVLDAGVRLRAGRGEEVPLLAAAWAGLPSTRCRGDQPAPSARARSAHARRQLRTAQP